MSTAKWGDIWGKFGELWGEIDAWGEFREYVALYYAKRSWQAWQAWQERLG